MSPWIIKAKQHGLKYQTSLWLLKLYDAKSIFFKPSGISIWQHPIPEQIPFTMFCVLLVITFGEAADGKRFTVENTIKVCVRVKTNGHELVFGDGNCETRNRETWIRIIFQRCTQLVVTVNGVIHQDVHLSFNGNVCNVEVSHHLLRLAVRDATVDKKSLLSFVTTFGCAKGIWNFYIPTAIGAIRQG